MAGRRAPSIVRSFSDFGNTSLKISLFFYHDRAPVMLHPCDHPLGLLQRRRHHAKPADGGDSRGEGLDEVSPGLEKAAAPFFCSVPSPFLADPLLLLLLLLRQLVLRFERRQERPVLPPLTVIGSPDRLLEQLPHTQRVDRPEEARVVKPPLLRERLRVAAKLQVSEGVVCFF